MVKFMFSTIVVSSHATNCFFLTTTESEIALVAVDQFLENPGVFEIIKELIAEV